MHKKNKQHRLSPLFLEQLLVQEVVRINIQSNLLFNHCNKAWLANILVSQVAQWSRVCLPKQVTQIWSLGQEDTLEKEMATYSSILAWRIWQTEEPGRLQSLRSWRVGHDMEANNDSKLIYTEQTMLCLSQELEFFCGLKNRPWQKQKTDIPLL